MHILAAIAYVQDLLLEPRAFAFLAYELDIGKELHLDRDRAVALANLTTTTGKVEREVRWIESASLRFSVLSEDFADGIVNLDVGHWV